VYWSFGVFLEKISVTTPSVATPASIFPRLAGPFPDDATWFVPSSCCVVAYGAVRFLFSIFEKICQLVRISRALIV
jgi:hypothetical protein